MNDLQDLIARAVKDVFGVDQPISLSRPDEQFGDYATNVAMQLAKPLGQIPREIATALAARITDIAAGNISEVQVAGPGFINLKLSDHALLQTLKTPIAKPRKGQKLLVEYSDPNPLKPLHAGHLYATLVGDIVARLLEQAGADVIRINYGGDVGLHVAKSLWAITRELGGEYPEKLDVIADADRPSWLGQRYVTGNSAYEDDENAKAEIIATNKRVYELHTSGDIESPFAQIYFKVRQWSYDYFNILYDQLRVEPFDRYIP
jgi:arginyl-tRNA synthetase